MRLYFMCTIVHIPDLSLKCAVSSQNAQINPLPHAFCQHQRSNGHNWVLNPSGLVEARTVLIFSNTDLEMNDRRPLGSCSPCIEGTVQLLS